MSSTRWQLEDPDASWQAGAAVPGASASEAGGLTISWENRPARLTAGTDAQLRFVVRDSSGATVMLEPYMGMPAHAAITREDGAVFVHLHPMGTISMTAQRQFERRSHGDTTLLPTAMDAIPSPHTAHEMRALVTFPYAFPSAGRYRIWVQMKVSGRVRTGVFDAIVSESP
jgi:hypothetical protein